MASRDVEIGYQPRHHQALIHAALATVRFAVLVCHRRFGKTVLAIATLVDSALRHKGGDGRFGYVAPYFSHAKDIAWAYVKLYALAVPGAVPNESELTVTFPNGSRIRLYGADNPKTLKGLYFDGIVLDEVADMRPDVWGEVIRPTLSDRLGWAIFIGTPKGLNLFHELYEFAKKTAGWYAGMFRADETQIIPESELELARAVMSADQYRQEFLCDFNASQDNVLITIDVVSAACRAAVVHEASLEGLPKVLTVDVARFGSDKSAIGKRWGHVFYEPELLDDVDNMFLAGEVARRWQEWKPDACFIDGGRGEGVIDRLRQIGFDPIEVNFGGKASNPHYHDKRTEMYDLARQWLVSGGSLPGECIDLKTELCAWTFDYKGTGGSMRLCPKDKVKEMLRRSPDSSDSFALGFAHPVMPMMTVGYQAEAGKLVSEYDPYPSEAA